MPRIASNSRRVQPARSFTGFLRDGQGTALIELAFVLPFLLILVIGIINMGGLFFLQNNMVNVARDSARSLSVGAMTDSEAVTDATTRIGSVTSANPDGDSNGTGQSRRHRCQYDHHHSHGRCHPHRNSVGQFR